MPRVLLIGATSAIAAEVARRCAARGDDLYLLARNPEKLEKLASDLGERVAGTEAGDFNELSLNPDRVARAIAALGGLDLVLIAHGDLGDQLRSERDPEEAWEIFAVNQMSVISFLIPLGLELERRRVGAIAVLSSVAADRGRPRNYTYAAAKSAVNVYLQGMRSRLWAAGVRVHILKLGPADTPMTVDHAKNPLFAEPGRLADDILRTIERGRSEAYLPWYWAPIMAIVRRLPEPLFQRIPFLVGR